MAYVSTKHGRVQVCGLCADNLANQGKTHEEIAKALGGNCEERYSLGIYAGTYCDPHWSASGYRKEDASGFDPLDAGETYEQEA